MPERKMNLAQWERILTERAAKRATRTLTPKQVKKFCSEEGGLYDLTEDELAKYPKVLKALLEIRSAYGDWGAKQATKH